MENEIMKRMKDFYEDRTRIKLTRRTNTILRVDGKAFHTYTKGLARPFDSGLIGDMDKTAEYLCQNIQGAKFAYVQSDEISILITDYDDLTTDAWFDNNLQKMSSIAASLATAKFNELRNLRRLKNIATVDESMRPSFNWTELENPKLAMFDARVFQITHQEEVVNYFIARQQDATRNSISSVAQAYFSSKELHGKKTNQMQDMLMLEKGINWNDFTPREKRGSLIRKVEVLMRRPANSYDANTSYIPTSMTFTRSKWEADPETPIFTQDKDYLRLMMPQERVTTESLV